MTTKQERERLLQGQDALASAIIARLEHHGWKTDRILRNAASKTYLPHTAVVRVELDSEYHQYWVRGEYTSVGQNVLSTCFACIKDSSTPTEIAAAVDKFLVEAEICINQSFAVRFIGASMNHLAA